MVHQTRPAAKPTVQPRFCARKKRKIRVTKPIATPKKPSAPLLNQIQADTLALPKVKTRQLAHLQRAIDDRRSDNPYGFIVVKGTSQSAFYQLERVVADPASARACMSTRLSQKTSDTQFDAQLSSVCRELRRAGGRKPDVLQLFWDEDESSDAPDNPKDMLAMLLGQGQSKSAAKLDKADSAKSINADDDSEDGNPSDAPDAAWLTRLSRFHRAIIKAAPQTKLVVYTPKRALSDVRKSAGYEVYDARLLGWDVDADGFALRASHLSRKFALALPESQLKSALRQAPFKQLEAIFDYASVLGAREQHTTPLEALRDAARNFHDRTEDGKAYDDIVACTIETQNCGQGSCGLLVPKGLQEFSDILHHFSMYQSVFTEASKALVFVGQDRAAKIGLLKDLAADSNALLIIPSTSDLLEMIADDSEEEFEGFLNNATSHANACGRSAIVYLGELDALLALGEKTEGTLGFNLVATQLSKLCDKAGRAPGWEDLVIVLGTQESVEYTCEPLAKIAFQAKTCAPSALQLQAVLRSSLALAHPAHALTDAELEHVAMLCLKTKSPFHVDDVELTLQRAARLAFCQRQPNQAPRITESHIRHALEDTRSKILDSTRMLYT